MMDKKWLVIPMIIMGVMFFCGVLMFLEIDYLYNKVDFMDARIEQLERYSGA